MCPYKRNAAKFNTIAYTYLHNKKLSCCHSWLNNESSFHKSFPRLTKFMESKHEKHVYVDVVLCYIVILNEKNATPT